MPCSSDLVAPPPSLAGPWSAVVGAAPLTSLSPSAYSAIACNPGAFVTSLWVALSSIYYPADGATSFIGALLMQGWSYLRQL
jgi:hypothetical protein